MDAETIAEALDGRREGREYRCLCPIHGGHSLMVRDGDDRPLWWCFGGCDGADIGRELARRGLLPSDEAGKEVARQKRLERDVDRARMLVAIAHEGKDVSDRFGADYRWARKVLAKAGYTVRFVPPHERQWPEQRVEVVARNRPKNRGRADLSPAR